MIKSREKALIIGAGVGGLVAATALAPHFKEVTILEKDPLPDKAEVRKGVGQGSHLHSLLLGGKNILEAFFPGFSEDLRQAGSNIIRAGLDQQIHEYGVWLPQRDLGYEIYTQSRYLLEQVIRHRVEAITNITITDQTHIDHLLLEDDRWVVGVRARSRGGSDIDIMADIVVDASGRGGKFVRQLSKQFEGLDKTDTIKSNIVYASAFVKKPKQWLDTKENVLIIAEPDQMAGGALIDIEDDHWCVSLHGRNGLVPPTDLESWVKFAAELSHDRIATRLADATEMKGVFVYKKPLSTWRRFDQAPHVPENYFPLGDVISSINPTFGQGMTVAISHCQALGNAFADTLANTDVNDVQQQYLSKSSEYSSKAWRVCAAYDASFKRGDEKSQRNFEIMRSLSLKRQVQAIENPEVHLKLFEQAQMINVFN